MKPKSLILAIVALVALAVDASAQRVRVRVRGGAGANVTVAAVGGGHAVRPARVNAFFVNGFAASPQIVGSPVILADDPRFVFSSNGVFIQQSRGFRTFSGGCGHGGGGTVLLGVGGGCW